MAAWIPAAIAGASAIGSYFSNRGSKKNVKSEMRRAQAGLDRATGGLANSTARSNEYIGDMRDMANSAYADANQTMEERFGRQLASAQDRIQQNTAANQNAISQALLARGGDLTGQGGAMMAGVNEQANMAQSDAINQYKTASDRMRMMENQRGDNLLARSLQASEGMANRDLQNYGLHSNLLTNANLMDIQRRQARSQMIMDAGATATENWNWS